VLDVNGMYIITASKIGLATKMNKKYNN
jgi:hypothetical protein